MSSLTVNPSVTTATSSPNPTDQGGQPPGGFGNTAPALSSSAALYLYTFLATLILLITISAAIIARSYCIRRRQRQLLDEAIRNGTYVPPPTTGTPNLKDKPVLYDIFLLASEGGMNVRRLKKKMRESESSETDFGEEWKEKSSWSHLMPLAAVTENPSVLVPTEEPSPPAAPVPSHTRWIPRRLQQRPRGGDVSLVPLGSGPQSPPGTPPYPEASASSSSSPSETAEPESMQLALFITMPSPIRKKPRHSYTSEEEEHLPVIEIGFTEVSVRPSEPRTDTGEAGGGPEKLS